MLGAATFYLSLIGRASFGFAGARLLLLIRFFVSCRPPFRGCRSRALSLQLVTLLHRSAFLTRPPRLFTGTGTFGEPGKLGAFFCREASAAAPRAAIDFSGGIDWRHILLNHRHKGVWLG